MLTTIRQQGMPTLHSRKVVQGEKIGMQVANIEVEVFGLPERMRILNAQNRTVDEIGRIFRALDCTMSTTVSAYNYTLCQEIFNLNDRLKAAGLLRFEVKKNMRAAYDWINAFFAFSKKNQGDKYVAWETVMSEVNGKVYEDLKVLRLINRRYALSVKGMKADADVAAQLWLVMELTMLCQCKIDLELRMFKEDAKISFDERMYRRRFDASPLVRIFDTILMQTTGNQKVLEDRDVATQMKVIIRKMDDADNYEDAARIAITENEGGVFSDELVESFSD